MDIREVAKWIANRDGCGCSDEEFAELCVLINKYQNDVPMKHPSVSQEEMLSFDIENFTERLYYSLDEIINSDEVCTGAWWKVHTEDT